LPTSRDNIGAVQQHARSSRSGRFVSTVRHPDGGTTIGAQETPDTNRQGYQVRFLPVIEFGLLTPQTPDLLLLPCCRSCEPPRTCHCGFGQTRPGVHWTSWHTR